MTLTEINDKNSTKKFLDVARQIYKNDERWVCPLDKDIESIFDPNQNTYFKHGEAIRWILKDNKGKSIGRIAAFIDFKSMDDNDQPTGGCGFFECIDNQDAANELFDAAKYWLKTKDIEAMDGPINFGEQDKFWGLLVDGFYQPAYKAPYNPPYYQYLFESYGFKIYYKQEGFHFDLRKPIPERFRKIAKRLDSKPEYSFEHFKFNDVNKYVEDFTTVFNLAWGNFKKDFEPLTSAYVRNFIMEGKMVLEEKFIWIAYYESQPVAIYLMIPDLNQIFKYFNGNLNLWNKIRLLFMVKTKKMTRAKGLLMGVIPKFQKKGIESGFILHLEKVFNEMPHYEELEFSWVGDFNPPMRKLWKIVGAEPAKHYITYRKLFDPNKKFKRYPIPE